MHQVQASEEELLIRLKSGDEAAFEVLYNIHVAKMYRYALGILKSPALAQDVIQDAFVKLWERAEEIRTDLPLQPYLFRIIRNLSLNTLRKGSRESSITEEIEAFTAAVSEDGFDFTQRKQAHVQLADAIAQLPPQRRRIYELCHQFGFTYKQAANELGIEPTTVNSQMVKAIRSIKAYLVRNGALIL